MLLVVSPLKLWYWAMSSALFLVCIGLHPATASVIIGALYLCWEVVALYLKCRHLNDGVRTAGWRLQHTEFL